MKGFASVTRTTKVATCVGGAQRSGRSTAKRLVTRAKVREIFMPALSSTMTEGKIVSWLKGSGEKITKGESIVVVESDKADMDVETFYDGYIGSIVVPDGATAAVGEPIAYIAETEAELEEAKSKSGGGGAPAAAAAEPEPEAPAAPPAEAAAPAPAAPAPAPAAPAPAAPAPAPVKRADGRVIATPYAKKLAKELGVDLSTLGGSGPNGRITASDVELAKSGGAPPAAPPASTPAATPAAPAAASSPPAKKAAPAAAAPSGDGEVVPFTGMQAAVSSNMIASLEIPVSRVAYTITTDAFDALYKKLKPKGVTMTALLSKAVAVALTKHPIMYAACTPAGDGIIYNENINIAVAVAMPDGGLITPVLQNADKTDIYQLSRNWGDLVTRARGKQLAPDEYSTGTFTISNLGMYGVDKFDAILPSGTGTIMAVGGSKPTVVATADGKIGVEKQMTINLTTDHRIIYGADAAEFCQTLKAVIENPDDLTM
ncbi:dihydrolipoamide acetyltransferase [Chloropicon primus]|nr:dihydrolipoamide acetyltransferase [Chloropicon primus]